MKKLSVLVLIITIFITTIFLCNSGIFAQTKSSWKKISEFKVHITNVVGFYNELYGLTVGNGGFCFYTNDGGKNWTQAQNRSWCRFGLEIVDEKISWNCGNAGNVRLSKDGGRTWVPVIDCGIAGNFISFIDDRIGWVASEEALIVTNDGGNSWTKPNVPTRSIGTISLLSESEGYLMDKNYPIMYITKDACKTWVTQEINLEEVPILPTMRWLNSKHAIMLGFSATEKKEIIFETFDAGISWKKEVIDDKICTPFISRDGKMLTLMDPNNIVRVFRRVETN